MSSGPTAAEANTTPAGTPRPAVAAVRSWPRRTAILLALLFVADCWWMGQGLFSLMIALFGMAALAVGTLWAALRGQRPRARLRLIAAGLYLLLGAATVGSLRLHTWTAKTRAEQIIAACRRYEARHGRLPERLQDLVPEQLSSVPRAKYTAIWGEFRYWPAGPNDYRLEYVQMPPFGRRIYAFGSGRWYSLD